MTRGALARTLLTGLGVAAIAIAAPALVVAHGLDQTYQSRLPLAVYLAGAGTTVALSFAFVLLRDLRATTPPDSGVRTLPPAWLRLALRALGLFGWLWIVAQGIAGGAGDADVGSLFLWVYGWVGVALISAFVGPIWHWLDPFSTIHDLGAGALRAVGVRGWPKADYPAILGRWPAVAGFAFFVWLELVLRGGIGRTLFIVLVGYTAYTLAMMAQFGRDEWRSRGEVFTVWFRLLGRLAPYALADEDGRIRRRPFGSGLLEPGWTRADLVFVALGVGSIIFDGISQTAPWYEIFGFPGVPIHTLQLLGFLGIVAVASVAVGRLVGVSATAAGLLPIAVGYLLAHYLTYLLIDGQRIVIAISDPLQRGADLFGTAFYEPSGDFLAPGLVWTIQLASVVGGHMMGAWAGHVVASRDGGGHIPSRDLRLRQVPLAVIMVTLTTVTLWSLGQAIVVTPEEEAAAPVVVTAGVVAGGRVSGAHS